MAERVKPESLEPIPEAYHRGQWKPVAFTREDGGDWIYTESVELPKDYYAIRYWNGWIFDTGLKRLGENPWRHWGDMNHDTPPHRV